MRTTRSLLGVVSLLVAQLCLTSGMAQASTHPALPGSLPATQALFAGTSGGTLLRADAGAYWRSRQNLDGQGIRVLVAAHDNHTLYAGTWGGVWRSTDGGARWHATTDGSNLFGLPINALAVNSRQPGVVYAAATDGLYQTTDGGASWLQLTNGLPSSMAVLSLAIDEHNPASVWAGTAGSGLYHSTDGGSTWTGVSDDVLSSYTRVQAIALSPTNSAVIYAGTGSGLYQSTDGGSSWVLLDSGLDPYASIDAVAVSPRQPSRVYVGTDGGAFVSTDGGSTWQQGTLSATLVHSIVPDPGSPLLAYAATTQGVYRTTDGGQTWADWSGGALDPGGDVASLALATIQTLPTDPAAPGCCGARFFAQTHHNLSGAFLAFWQHYGGLDTFGYPRTEPFSEGGHLVQYTDRFRLDLFNGRVTTAPLGRTLTAGRSFPAVPPFASTANHLYFGATGHSLSGRFLSYWRAHKGSTLLGAPIAEPDREPNNDGTGRVYLVQWCEKGRLEYHAELAGTKYEVQLGLLGKQDLLRRGWL